MLVLHTHIITLILKNGRNEGKRVPPPPFFYHYHHPILTSARVASTVCTALAGILAGRLS
eukprot:c31153_g1_i1 orf=85-264(+)